MITLYALTSYKTDHTICPHPIKTDNTYALNPYKTDNTICLQLIQN